MTQGIRTHRFVRRNVVLHREVGGETQKFHSNLVKSPIASLEHPPTFADALGAFADDAGWEDFVAAVEAGQRAQNELEVAENETPGDWDSFHEVLAVLRQKRSDKHSNSRAEQ